MNAGVLIKKSAPRMAKVSSCSKTRNRWLIKTVPYFTGTKVCLFTHRLLSLKALTSVRCCTGSSRDLFSLCFIFSYKFLFIRVNSHPASRIGRLGVTGPLTKQSCLSVAPPLPSLPPNTKTQLQTRTLSSLSILLTCTARGDGWMGCCLITTK